jgi:hypothetical protein
MSTIEFLRQFRIGGYAIFDFVVSFIGIYLISPLLSRLFRIVRLDIPKLSWMFFTIPIGILAHVLSGRITPLTAWFLDLHSHYIVKIVVIVLIVLGVKDIKILRK